MATEYTTANYLGRSGFSLHSLCRMQDFYQMYEGYLEALKQVMEVGWTQNIVILEADLDMGARCWYLQAAQQFSTDRRYRGDIWVEGQRGSSESKRTIANCFWSYRDKEHPPRTVAASAQKTQYSPYRQRIMSNKAVKFIYAKNKGQLHDKSCPEVQKIPDEELCCSGKYLSNISHSNVSVVR